MASFELCREWFGLRNIPYLPVYNARPCIIRTLIFDHVIKKKRFQDKHQELKLPCFHLINKSWEFINDMFTCLLTYLLKLQISHAPSTYLHAFLFNKSIDEGFLSASVDLVCTNNSFEKVIEMFNLTRLMLSFIGASYTQSFW